MASQASSMDGWQVVVVCSGVQHMQCSICMYLRSDCRCVASRLLIVPVVSSFACQNVLGGGCLVSAFALLLG